MTNLAPYKDNNGNLVQPSVRGNSWHIVDHLDANGPDKRWTARRLRSHQDLSTHDDDIVLWAPSFDSVLQKVEAFEIEEETRKTNTTILMVLGLGVVGVGAYFMLRKKPEPSIDYAPGYWARSVGPRY